MSRGNRYDETLKKETVKCIGYTGDRQKKQKEMSQKVLQTHLEFEQRYGSVKIAKTLNKRDVKVSERTVFRIMSKNKWKSCTVKKYKATTNSNHQHPVSENILNRQFKVSKPN